MFAGPAEVISEVKDGKIKLGEKFFVFRWKDDMKLADKIRALRLLGTGICNTKNKPIDLYWDETRKKMYGVSAVRLDRCFFVGKIKMYIKDNELK